MDFTSYRAPERRLPESLENVNLSRFFEGLLELFASLEDEIAAEPGVTRQAYTSLVLEVAGKSNEPEQARAFASHFTSKGAPYTESRNGIAALLLETWLALRGGVLFGQFLETVLDPNRRTFVAIFTGKVSPDELEKMQTETVEFVRAWELLVKYDDRDHENGLVSDVTIFECVAGAVSKKQLAQRKSGPSAQKLQRGKPQMSGPEAKSFGYGGAAYSEGLLPRTRTEYERVIAEGGLSSNAVQVVFGMNPFRDVTVAEDTAMRVDDPNGVVWESKDRGTTWLPRIDEFRSYSSGPKLARALPGFSSTTNTPSSNVSNPAPQLDKPKKKKRKRQYEAGAGDAARSYYGSWAVLESPIEGGITGTVVAVRDKAWAVAVPVEEMRVALDRVDVLYDGLPEEFDLVAEAFLEEFADEQGVPVENVAEILSLYESADARTLRDDTIDEHNENRLREMSTALLPLKGELVRWLDRTGKTRVTLDAVMRFVQMEKWAKRLSPTEKDVKKVLRALGWRKRGAAFVVEAEGEEEPPEDAPEPAGIQDEPDSPEGDEDEPATTDRMERPPYYRDDLQKYFDLQKALDKDDEKSLAAVRKKFKIAKSAGLEVMPTGEVRMPGVVDDPEAAKRAPAPLGTPPPPPPPEPGEAPEAPGGPPGAKEPGQANTEPPKGQETSKSASVSSKGGVTTVKSKSTTSTSESAPAGAVPVETLDDAFMFFITYVEDAYLDGFAEWVDEHAPHLAGGLAAWSPTDRPLQEGLDLALVRDLVKGGAGGVAISRTRSVHRARERRESKQRTDEQRSKYERWRRLTNLSVASLLEFHKSDVFDDAFKRGADKNLARESARFLARMKRTPMEEWDETLWNWCGRQTRFIERLRKSPGRLVEGGKLTRKCLALRAWGHNPAVRESVQESAILEANTPETIRALHRMIDSLPGPGPHAVVGEEDVEEGPRYPSLKQGRAKLTDDECASVMDAGAVWHHGPKGEATPAVWKSTVKGKTYYVVNTQRAFKVADSLSGAIKNYPAIKLTNSAA